MWGILFSPSSDWILGPFSEFGTHIPIAIFYIELLQQLDVRIWNLAQKKHQYDFSPRHCRFVLTESVGGWNDYLMKIFVIILGKWQIKPSISTWHCPESLF